MGLRSFGAPRLRHLPFDEAIETCSRWSTAAKPYDR